MLGREEIEALEAEHQQAPHLRALQKALAREITMQVHSEADYNAAVEASEILFGKGTTEALRNLSEKMFLAVFDGVPRCKMSRATLEAGVGMIDFLSQETGIFASKGEARRALKENSVSVNKEKVNEETPVNTSLLLNNAYILVQKGKKNYYVVQVR